MSSDDKNRSDTPRVNGMLYAGRVQQNDGWWVEGGEWVRAEDARQLERELAEADDAIDREHGRAEAALAKLDEARREYDVLERSVSAVADIEPVADLINAADRVCRKYGRDDAGNDLDWTEWQDVRDALRALKNAAPQAPSPATTSGRESPAEGSAVAAPVSSARPSADRELLDKAIMALSGQYVESADSEAKESWNAAVGYCIGALRTMQEQLPASASGDAQGKLTKPALVGNTRFGVGVAERMVIERAQREYEYQVTPEKEAARIERAKAAFAAFGNPCTSCGTPAPGACEADDCPRRDAGSDR